MPSEIEIGWCHDCWLVSKRSSAVDIDDWPYCPGCRIAPWKIAVWAIYPRAQAGWWYTERAPELVGQEVDLYPDAATSEWVDCEIQRTLAEIKLTPNMMDRLLTLAPAMARSGRASWAPHGAGQWRTAEALERQGLLVRAVDDHWTLELTDKGLRACSRDGG